MKKYIGLLGFACIMYSCDSSTYESIEEPAVEILNDVTYNANTKSIVDANCIVCHSPGGQASFRPLTTYTEVRNAILNRGLLQRIQLQKRRIRSNATNW